MVTAIKTCQTYASVARTGGDTVDWTAMSKTTIIDSDPANWDRFGTTEKYSRWLRLTNFGFTTSDLPNNAIITGIEVTLVRRATYADCVSDSAIYLRKGADQRGNNGALAGTYATTYETVIHGSSTDDWGAFLTRDDILSTDFGIDISCNNNISGASGVARIDYVGICIYYSLVTPTTYAIELRNASFNLVKRLEKISSGLRWKFGAVGGCGTGTLTLKTEELSDIGPDYDVQVYSGGSLLYRGFVETYKPVQESSETLTLNLQGYSGQLKRVRVKHTYSNMAISEIVKDILTNYVISDTSVLQDDTYIDDSTYSIDTLAFDCMADEALSTLAGIEGNVDWGVDKNRTFFFKKTTTDITHRFHSGVDISKNDSVQEYGDIVNQVVIKGGTVSGATFEYTVDNTESQNLYGLRSEIISNSAIVTSSVAQQYGTTYLASKAVIQRRASITIANCDTIFEDTLPLGCVTIIKSPVTEAKIYNDDDAIYGSFIYGSLQSFQISAIDYEMQNQNLKAVISLGALKPDIADQIKKLEYEINQLKSR